MTRPRPAHYTGATGHAIPPDAIAGLDFDRHALMLKADGLYCTLTTDARGRIDSAVSQLGRPIPEAADLLGIVAAPPFSTLAGELTAHTEAGRAEAEELGYPIVHLFDCTRLAGQPLQHAPYQERHGALYRAQSWVESEGYGRARDWTLDARGNAHALSRSAERNEDRGCPSRSGLPRSGVAGRFVAAVPRDLRRLPVLPLARGLADARALWDLIESTGLEGAVAVDLRARVGAPRSKRKIKLTDTVSATVLGSDATASLVVADFPVRGPVEFTLGSPLPVGAIVEVAYNKFYRSGLPKFARVVRRRCDKAIGPVTDRGALIEWAA